jgi:transcriptional regulator with XRE-family HTH domain
VALKRGPANNVSADLRTHGGRLKAARLAAGLTHKQMAFRLKLSIESISDKERERKPISHEQLHAWSQHCDCSLEWLITGAGNGPDLSSVDHVTMEGEVRLLRHRVTELERVMRL